MADTDAMLKDFEQWKHENGVVGGGILLDRIYFAGWQKGQQRALASRPAEVDDEGLISNSPEIEGIAQPSGNPGELQAIRYRYPTRIDLEADVNQETAAIATAVSAMSDALEECPLTDSLKIYAAIELAFKYCDPKHVEEVFDEIVYVRSMK